MKEKAPQSKKRPKERLTEEEAAARVVEDEALSFELKLFAILKKSNPALAAELRPDFEECVRVNAEMAKEDPTGDYSINDVEKRIPNNKWLRVMKRLAEFLPPSSLTEQTEEGAREFRRDVAKKMKGEDIN